MRNSSAFSEGSTEPGKNAAWRPVAAPFGGAVGKDTVSRTWRKVKSDWDAWNTRSFAEEPIVRLILDGTVGACGLTAKRPPSRSWSYRRTSGWPKGSARDQEHGWESAGAWRTVLDDLIKRGLLGPSFASSMARPGSTAGGYAVALMARGANQRPGGGTRRCACLRMRCTDAAFVKNAFARVSVDLGEVEFLIYNAGSGSGGSIEEITPEAFEAARRVNALGSLLVSRQVIPAMKRVGAGSIIFIGATASLPGMPRTAAFAPRQGRAAHSCEVHGALTLARRHSLSHRDSGRRGRPPENPGDDDRQER